MAISKCPRCDSTRFEVKVNEPKESKFKLLFVQCAACGTVVGVLDYLNIGAMTMRHEELLKQVAAKLGLDV